MSVAVDIAPGVHYALHGENGASVLTTPWGTVAMKASQVDVRDTAHRTVFGTPIDDASAGMAHTADSASVPASADAVAGATHPSRTATVTDRLQTTVSPTKPAAANESGRPVAQEDMMSDLNQSVEAANQVMGLTFGFGSTVGSVLGAVAGCPFGMATGGTLMSLASLGTMTVPVMVAACLTGAVAGGGVGAMVGGLAFAIPTGIAAGTQKFNQLQAQHAAAQPAPSAATATVGTAG